MSSPPSESRVAPEIVEIVWFSGPDTVRFLNDLISQEIGDLEDGQSRRSFLLSPQGKLDFMFWVTRSADRIGLVIEGGRGEDLAAALRRYRIRVDVEIAVEPGVLVIGDVDGIDVSWGGGLQRTVRVGETDLPEMTETEYESLRIGAGEPRWGTDVDDSTIPHESGLVAISVDFDKGCYLGQELVARIDSRGANTPRKLRRLSIDGDLEPGSVLTVEDREVGVVTSARDGAGLGMIRREIEPESTLHVGDVAVVVKDLTPNLIR